MLKVGDQVPEFAAVDQKGVSHRLSDYRGKWLLLYFYPKDDTPGCTTEACNFRDNLDRLNGRIEVVGVSADSQASHKRFADKYNLNFTILADPQKEIIRAFGTNGVMAKRMSFLINPDGKIAKVYPKVDPKEHVDEILQDLEVLKVGVR